MIRIGPDLTTSKVISAQVRAERDTYPVGYSNLILWKALPSNERDLLGRSCMGKYFMRTQIDPKSSLTGTGSSFRINKHFLLIRERETILE